MSSEAIEAAAAFACALRPRLSHLDRLLHAVVTSTASSHRCPAASCTRSAPTASRDMARGRHADRALEAGMVAPVHLPYPCGEHERMSLEKVVGEDGGRPPFSRGCGALTGR